MAESTTAVRAVQPRSRFSGRTSSAARLENRHGWLFAAPTAVLVLGLFIAPLVVVLIMATANWTLLGGNQGGNFPLNFVNVFKDPLLQGAIWFTIEYTIITTVILMPIAFGLALLVQEARKWNAFLRTAILIPSAMGIASASLLFYALYSPQIGPLMPLLNLIPGFQQGESILSTPGSALWATVLLVVWRFAGFYMLLMMVGLQAIPGDVYEAAKLDGAGRVKTLTSVTIPLLRPTIAMTLIMSITGSLLAFDQFFILTEGGPNNSTMTIVQLIYREAFQTNRDLGMAAALTVILLVALVIINAIQLRVLRVGADED